MVVCRDCLMAIISRGELDKGYEVIEVGEHCTCDWCDEELLDDEVYEI